MEVKALQFYTCVNRYFDKLLYRGYDNGRPVAYEVPYEPTIYEGCTWKTGVVGMDGRFVEPKSFKSMKECGDYIKMYKDVGSKYLYGNKNYVNQFITEKCLKIELKCSLIPDSLLFIVGKVIQYSEHFCKDYGISCFIDKYRNQIIGLIHEIQCVF